MIRIAALSCAALALSACASIDPYPAERPVLAPKAYAGDLPESGVAEDWWEGFNDPVLEELVDQGLAANIDIAIARDLDEVDIVFAIRLGVKADDLVGILKPNIIE